MTKNRGYGIMRVLHLLDVIGSYRGAWFTAGQIATRSRIAKRTIDDYLKALTEEAKLLEREKIMEHTIRGQPAYRYRFVSRYPLIDELKQKVIQQAQEIENLKALLYSDMEDFSA